LRLVFPGKEDSLYAVMRFIRYGLAGAWIGLGAPWIFLRLGLAEARKASV